MWRKNSFATVRRVNCLEFAVGDSWFLTPRFSRIVSQTRRIYLFILSLPHCVVRCGLFFVPLCLFSFRPGMRGCRNMFPRHFSGQRNFQYWRSRVGNVDLYPRKWFLFLLSAYFRARDLTESRKKRGIVV